MTGSRNNGQPVPEVVVGSRPIRPPSLATHYLRYSTAHVLVILAGLVSFPVLTRLLDNHQYGILGYYDTLAMIAVAVVKLGSQHALLRFYPAGGDPAQHVRYATNLLLVPGALSFGLWLSFVVLSFATGWFGESTWTAVFWVALFTVPMTAMNSQLQMVLLAGERSGLLMLLRVGGRWLELGLVLAAVVWIQRSALAVFGGKLAATALLLVFYIAWMSRHLHVARTAFDPSAVREGLVYGLPLMANELANLVLMQIDRVMIKSITGDFAAVGIYTIGYSLASQISVLLSAALSEAFVPVANRLYASDGEAAVRKLKERVLLPLTYVSIGIAAMLLAVGQDALVALSSQDKAASGIVFVIVGMTLALFPLVDICGYGLLLHKRSMTLFVITLGVAVFNVLLNFLLIPRMGLIGAAWSTVASYIVLGAARCLACPRGLLVRPDTRALAVAGGCALLLLVAVHGSDLYGITSPWGRVALAGAMFIALYALPVWLLDPRLHGAFRTLRGGGPGAPVDD